MITKMRKFSQRLTPVVMAQAFGLLCGLAGVKLISRFVPPDVLGDYGIFLSFTTLGMWVVHTGLIKYVSRHWAAAPDKPALSRVVLRHWWGKSPWIVLCTVGAAQAISWLTGNAPWGLLLPLFIVISLLSLVAMAQAALQTNREHWSDLAVSATGSLTRTFAPLILFLVLGGAVGLYAGFSIHAIFTLLVASWILRKYVSKNPTTRVRLELDRIYTGPYFTMLSLAGWALTGTNRWIVAGFFGDVEAGYFMLASNMVLIVPTIIGTIFIQMFQPGFFALGDSGNHDASLQLARRVDRVAAGFGVISIVGILLLHLVMPWLVGPLVHETYGASLAWIVPVGCFSVATITGQYYHSMLLAARKERACAPVDLTAASLLIMGSTLAALAGRSIFMQWLMITPLIPWLVTRSLARHYYFKRS